MRYAEVWVSGREDVADFGGMRFSWSDFIILGIDCLFVGYFIWFIMVYLNCSFIE